MGSQQEGGQYLEGVSVFLLVWDGEGTEGQIYERA